MVAVMKRGDRAKKIRALALKHPNWSYRQIADACHCDLSRVSQVLKAAGRPQSIFALGKAARDHGFTIPMLKALGAKMQGVQP
jgi:hypothetical protein